MWKALDIKFKIALLAAVLGLSALLIRIEQHTAEQARLAQQQAARDEAIQKHDEEFRRQVEEAKKKAKYAGNESKTANSYY